MGELSYPTSGGGSVTDRRYEQLIGQYGPSGLVGDFDSSQKLIYADSTGRHVKVRPNRSAIVRGFRWETDAAGVTLPVLANTSGFTRYDRVVLRLNRSTWVVELDIIEGQPSSSPQDPNYTVQLGEDGTGFFEIPLARIVVAHNAATINPGDVVSQAYNIGGFDYRGEKANPPYTTGGGHHFYAVDNQRLYAALNVWHIIGENKPTVAHGAGSSGWDCKWVYYQRWNGFVYFQGLPVRTGAALGPGTDSTICVIPSIYRPPTDTFLVAWYSGQPLRAWIDAGTGDLRVLDYPTNINTGASVTIHPVTWPANNG